MIFIDNVGQIGLRKHYSCFPIYKLRYLVVSKKINPLFVWGWDKKKTVPLNHRLSSLGKPHDANRWFSGHIFYSILTFMMVPYISLLAGIRYLYTGEVDIPNILQWKSEGLYHFFQEWSNNILKTLISNKYLWNSYIAVVMAAISSMFIFLKIYLNTMSPDIQDLIWVVMFYWIN